MKKDIYTELIEIGIRLIQLGLNSDTNIKVPPAINIGHPSLINNGNCPICNISPQDGMFYVCNHSDCPGRTTCSS